MIKIIKQYFGYLSVRDLEIGVEATYYTQPDVEFVIFKPMKGAVYE